MSNHGPNLLTISQRVSIPYSEIELTGIRAQGAGGQHVNKTSSAIHLRFDIKSSSLPDFYKARLLKMTDRRITGDGIIIIKAQGQRSQERNRADALLRLQKLITDAAQTKKVRRPSRPTKSSNRKRLDSKKNRGKLKTLRKNIVV